MRLTRFVHACLLAETSDKTVLFDPGEYSWESGIFDREKLSRLDAIVITHIHPDHFHPPFVEALTQKFPQAHFITTPAVATELQKMGASNVSTDGAADVQIFSKKTHALLEPLSSPTPENIAVHFDRLSVGGDRQDLEETKEILAFTITAPWGSVRSAAEMVLRLRPKYAFPLHDWHWHEQARQQQYERFEKALKGQGITFIRPKDGEPVEI